MGPAAERSEAILTDSIRKKLSSGGFLPDLTLGGLLGLTETFFAVSLASLIFSGDLSQYLNLGISIALLAAAVTLVVTTALSSIPGGVGSLQDGPNVLLAVVVGSFVGAVKLGQGGDLLATVLVTMFIATLSTGTFLMAMGVFRLGGLVRYVPYPVVGGFLAGTGWLLMRGSFEVVTGLPATISSLSRLLNPDIIILWLPTLIVGLILFVGIRRYRNVLTLPGLLVGLLIVFHLGLILTGTPLSTAQDMGLLLIEDQALTPSLPSPGLLRGVSWQAIFGQAGNIAVIAGIALVSLLLNATSLELAFQKDLDINRELRAAGATNLFTSFTGGMVGYLSVAFSTLMLRTGSSSRLPSAVAALVVALMLLLGFGSLAYFPKAILGGLLLFLGIEFVNDWVIGAFKRFTAVEYGVIFLILIVIAITDFLIGVGVGLIAMIIMFVVSYSRVSVVQHILSGAHFRSNVERNAIELRDLAHMGESIFIAELRGFLFFGTANAMVDLVRERILDSDRTLTKFVLLDFMNVTGLDSSAALSFVKAEQLAKRHGFTLVLTGASAGQRRRLQIGGLSSDSQWVSYFADMDRGMEWCEEQLLKSIQTTLDLESEDLASNLSRLGMQEELAERLIAYLEPVTVQPGERLIRQGEPSEALFYIESGGVSVYLERQEGDPIRLRNLRTGATVGEMGLYTGAARTASVIAEQPTIAYRLDLQAIGRMTSEEPDLAAGFHRWIAQLLSRRLGMATRTIEALQPR